MLVYGSMSVTRRYACPLLVFPRPFVPIVSSGLYTGAHDFLHGLQELDARHTGIFSALPVKVTFSSLPPNQKSNFGDLNCTVLPPTAPTFVAVARALPPAMRQGIRGLELYEPRDFTMSALVVFLREFENLTTLKCGEMLEGWKYVDWNFSGPNEASLPPPSSITKLILSESGHLPSQLLKWFTDLHIGSIKTLSAWNILTTYPVEFRNSLNASRDNEAETASAWSELDQIFAGTTFPSLHKLTILTRDRNGSE
ncbi:hypothetical protein K438DRAFT_2037190 [Mycena galopus ATCC 62051]|nr:hypothetical protein K438DRAFT_2037190 [Mycena galopus ATCC 62051]